MRGIIFTLLCVLTLSASAAGPLVLEGPAENTPVRYLSTEVSLNFDSGMLGSRSNSITDALVNEALALWSNVSTANITLIQHPVDLIPDVDATNYFNIIPPSSLTSQHPSIGDGISPIVYDSDGGIIDSYVGTGQSNYIIGFAASVVPLGGYYFREGYAVINGKIPLSDDKLVQLVTHEIGHLLGLDHSQLNIDRTESNAPDVATSCSTATFSSDYPVMYPVLCRTDRQLHPDDEISLSMLYPSADQQLGQLRGKFTNIAGIPILGANIWVENLATDEAYSVVSDHLKRGDGSYSLLLPEGSYSLHANSINDEFFEASSVGPYASTAFDISFQSPHTLAPIDVLDIIYITTGSATVVDFKDDGSTNISTGQIIPLVNKRNAPPSSDGGSLSLMLLILITTGLWFNRILFSSQFTSYRKQPCQKPPGTS